MSHRPPRSSRLSVALFSGLLISTSSLFFAGGYLSGHQDGRTGTGPLVQAGLVAPPASVSSLSAEDQRHFGILWEALSEIDRRYYQRDALDRDKLAQGAVKGLVEAMGDPHSAYLTPERRAAVESHLRGSLEGIGVELDIRDGKLRVVAPLDDTPAQRAGIRPRDVITHVDGQSVARLSLTDAVAKLRGPKGSSLTLTVVREGEAAPLTFALTREEIKLALVRSRLLEQESGAAPIGYLRVTSFADPTAQQLRQQLRQLLQGEPAPVGLVLDLRGNPGGYLHSAVEVASQFVQEGVVLHQARNERATERKTYRASGSAQVPDLPLAVLIDHGSASASEIVAAALRDNERAVLVGETTFGKGTVQELHRLSDQSQLRVTVAQWLTPDGQPIHGQGLVPDLAVTPAEDRDAALDRAVAHLREQWARSEQSDAGLAVNGERSAVDAVRARG